LHDEYFAHRKVKDMNKRYSVRFCTSTDGICTS